MNDQIPTGDEHGALGDAEYAEFMELAAEEGFDLGEVEGDIAAPATVRCPSSPSSAVPMSVSRPW